MNVESPSMWHENSPGHFERALDEAELFYHTMAKTWQSTGHTYFAITACAGLAISHQVTTSTVGCEAKVVNALQSAWKRLRYEHPTLAAAIEFDPVMKKGKKVYKTPKDDRELERWLEETFKVVSGVNPGQDFANSDPAVGRYATLYILNPLSSEEQLERGVVRKDLVLRSGHDTIDGIGTLKLFNNLFTYTADAYTSDNGGLPVIFGDEQKNLSPPLKVAIRMPTDPTDEQVLKFQILRAANDKARENIEVLGVPITLQTTMPGRSNRTVLQLSVPDTVNIISKCKSFGVTPTHLFHAGIALALRDIQKRSEQQRKARYISYALVNLRGACGEQDTGDRHPASVLQTVSVNHLVVDLTVPAKSDPRLAPKVELVDILKQVRDFYKNIKLDDDFLSTAPLLFKTVTPRYPETTSKVPDPNLLPPVSLSSLGIINKVIKPQNGPFRVIDPWVMGAEYSTGLGLFLATWNGEICLSAGYNVAFHEAAEVLDFLERVTSVVWDIVDSMS